MPRQIESLDQLLRAKAEAQLIQEVNKAFNSISKYFTGEYGSGYLEVKTSFGIRRTDEPSGVEHAYTMSVSEMFKWLREKAVANLTVDRGNQAVEQFLNRVQEVGDQLDELRETVDNHLQE